MNQRDIVIGAVSATIAVAIVSVTAQDDTWKQEAKLVRSFATDLDIKLLAHRIEALEREVFSVRKAGVFQLPDGAEWIYDDEAIADMEGHVLPTWGELNAIANPPPNLFGLNRIWCYGGDAFHLWACPYLMPCKTDRLVRFSDRKAAIQAELEACALCNP